MPRNLYASVDAFKRRFITSGSVTLAAGDITEIERVLESGARRCDEATHRHYFDETSTKVFDADYAADLRELWLPDLLAATTVKLDEDGNRTFEITLNSATDYYLVREGNDDEDALPKTLIRLDDVNGQRSTFAQRKRVLQIAGRWGYTDTKERLATGMTATLADASTKTMTTAGTPPLSVGDTLLLEGEQVYVESGSASPFTVARAVNGTTAASHAGVAIDRYTYVPEVVEASLIMAGRLWKRRETQYANVIANPVVGSYETFKSTDPDAAMLLAPFVRGDRLAVA